MIPVHNSLRDAAQIEKLLKEIEKGSHILEKDGLPNIKLALAGANKLLLFDGHHTLLSYLLAGKVYLSEVPFLLVSPVDSDSISSGEIAYFFPEEARDKVEKDWEKFVVNWEAPREKQLETRSIKSLGELADEFRKRDKSPVKE